MLVDDKNPIQTTTELLVFDTAKHSMNDCQSKYRQIFYFPSINLSIFLCRKNSTLC